MSLLSSQRVDTSSTVPNLKKRSKMPLGLVVLILTALSSPTVVNAVTTPSVAPGVTPSVLYHHPDAMGNLAAMTDASGQVAWRAQVRPFGLGSANPQDYPLRFLDQPLEAEIGAEGGLYHLGARTYDPVAGRFLTTDPLPLIGIPREEPQRFNRYAYGLNNPYRYMDPTGLNSLPAEGPVTLPSLEEARERLERWARASDLDLYVREIAGTLARTARLQNVQDLAREAAAVGELSVTALSDFLKNAENQGLIRVLNHPGTRTGVTEIDISRFGPGRTRGVIIALILASSLFYGNEALADVGAGDVVEAGVSFVPGFGDVYPALKETAIEVWEFNQYTTEYGHCWPNCQHLAPQQ